MHNCVSASDDAQRSWKLWTATQDMRLRSTACHKQRSRRHMHLHDKRLYIMLDILAGLPFVWWCLIFENNDLTQFFELHVFWRDMLSLIEVICGAGKCCFVGESGM